MDRICDVCGINPTGRLIGDTAVCTKCFIEGEYNLPENQAKLNGKRAKAEKEPKSRLTKRKK
jgi:hypothetical protein